MVSNKGESETPNTGSWQERLAIVVAMMREISEHTDPQAMVRAYGNRVAELTPRDSFVSLSRRGLSFPEYRVTRSSQWTETINPWKEKERLPLLRGGLLADLAYGEEPHIIDDLSVASDDPARDYLDGMRSLMALPLYDGGHSINMVVMLKRSPRGFDFDRLPEMMWISNLFGRATQSLVLSDELKAAYHAVDRELKAVADIQRSLLPRELPRLATLELAASYETSRRAGGDYYDFFRIDEHRLGIMIADVSGHGTPAAVLMAVLHSIAHTYVGTRDDPAAFLTFLNEQLCKRYTTDGSLFVTAFYGIYDDRTRVLTFSNAGHNQPRVKHCVTHGMSSIEGATSFPLGIDERAPYTTGEFRFRPGDQVIFYTDGIPEAMNTVHDLFGAERMDDVLRMCAANAHELIHAVLAAVNAFTGTMPPTDDRTLLVARIS
jgi:sigma-B regulation protein RsbU (phosphoserine phosphatase)